MFDDITIYVPSKDEIVAIYEGTGDNLLQEDIRNGYVDYVLYDQYLRRDLDVIIDAGQVMYKELLAVKYRSIKDCIPDVLEEAHGDRDLPYVVLEPGMCEHCQVKQYCQDLEEENENLPEQIRIMSAGGDA